MKTNTLKKSDVKSFWTHYRNKVKKHPELYNSNDKLITVVLPKYLLKFSEKRSGHSGYVAHCRPLGIRRYVNDSSLALKEIFKSVDSLAAFIRESDSDGMLRYGERSNIAPFKFSFKQYLSPRDQKLLDSPAKTHAAKAWGDKHIFQRLAAIYGKDTVINAANNLTVEEVGFRFGIEMPRGYKRVLVDKNKSAPVRRGVGSY